MIGIDLGTTNACAAFVKNGKPTVIPSREGYNTIPSIVAYNDKGKAISPKAKGRGYTNTIAYTHSSTLRTLQEIFGVTPLLGGAAGATDLRDLFTSFP